MSWIKTKKYTLEEFWELPEPPDHSKLELIGGVLYMTPPPGYRHNDAVTRLLDLLSEFKLRNRIDGRMRVPRAAIWRTPNTYLEPDLFYVSAETQKQQDPNYPTTADLVVEVISPSSAIYDRNTKADAYAVMGVKELWLIDESRETVEIRVLVDGKFERGKMLQDEDLVSSKVLPGFEFQARRLFND